MIPMIPAVQPKVVAATVAAARRLESPELAQKFNSNPRLAEMLWFLQYHSLQPGGLVATVDRLVRLCPEFFTADALSEVVNRIRAAGCPDDVGNALEQLPDSARVALLGDDGRRLEIEYAMALLGSLSFGDVMVRDHCAQEIRRRLSTLTPDQVLTICHSAARMHLPTHLARLCNEPNAALWDQAFWYCQAPVDAVLKFMGIHAAEILGRLSDTAVARQILEAVDYSRTCSRPVWIYGNSRIGKTTVPETYCQAYPGRARMFNVPAGESDVALLREVARGLGISFTYTTPRGKLDEEIEWVLSNSDLQLVFDEAHFLFPECPTRRRPTPTRLNWVRRTILDRKLPCVMLATPQSCRHAEGRLVAASYPIEQWLGRNIYRVKLPDPCEEDVLAVACRLFPQFQNSQLLTELAGRAVQHDGQLEALTEVSVRAHYLASKAGRKLSIGDVRQAEDEILPSVARKPVSNVKQQPCSEPAKPRIQEPISRRSASLGKVSSISTPSPVPA